VPRLHTLIRLGIARGSFTLTPPDARLACIGEHLPSERHEAAERGGRRERISPQWPTARDLSYTVAGEPGFLGVLVMFSVFCFLFSPFWQLPMHFFLIHVYVNRYSQKKSKERKKKQK